MEQKMSSKLLYLFLAMITFDCFPLGCWLALICMHIFQDKKSLKLAPDDHLHLEGFALNVFAKADKQDRAGRADMYNNMYFILMCEVDGLLMASCDPFLLVSLLKNLW